MSREEGVRESVCDLGKFCLGGEALPAGQWVWGQR